MTTELVLLLALWAFIAAGAMFGEKGPIQVFARSGPRLAARIERHISVGREFKGKGGQVNQWVKPDGQAPDGKL